MTANPLLQNSKPGWPIFVSDTGEGANRLLASVTTTTVVVPTGTTQATALPLLPGRNIILTAPVGSGVIVTAPYQATATVINLSATVVNCFPPIGSKFYLQVTNAPVALAASSITEFATADGLTFFVLTNVTLNLSGLPTTLPTTAGILWNNGGVLCIS